MTNQLLATTYPGGGFAVISAILWLFFTGLAPFALLIGCLGIWRRFAGFTFPLKSLRLAIFTALLAFAFLVLETVSVGWDAFFIMEDKKYFYEQFPANFIRAAVDFAVLLPSWLAYRKMNPRANQ